MVTCLTALAVVAVAVALVTAIRTAVISKTPSRDHLQVHLVRCIVLPSLSRTGWRIDDPLGHVSAPRGAAS